MDAETLKGHLDLLLLAAVETGGQHGYAIIDQLRRRSRGTFDLAEGTVYPALHRLEHKGWIASEWKTSEVGPRLRVYRLTQAGRRQLMSERSRWERLTTAIAGILNPTEKENVP